ncbi:glycoside hydrolase family 20 zincin-like fold domain-containing protein [Coprobacillaceae bacterium CR2/5/TPMF4]|nr:glycoside hydrolase family 20 zincin-like fold domain-containing protein [Coprobacillaceae bacterium CR2/5/TPMF4]
MILCTFANANVVKATDDGYEIYPNPQSITYGTGDFILRDNVNVVYEDGIDQDTKNRLQEVTDLKTYQLQLLMKLKLRQLIS